MGSGKIKRVYQVMPGREGNTVWAKPNSNHPKGDFCLAECNDEDLEYLYEEVGCRHDVYMTEMPAEAYKAHQAQLKKKEKASTTKAKEKKADEGAEKPDDEGGDK